jgi:hypothetical protein
MELLEYGQVSELIGNGRCHLLLGNGFSIACDRLFSYGSLFEYASANGLNDRAKGVFEYLGTNNFEGVMRLLEIGQWLSRHYGGGIEGAMCAAMAEDLESVKSSLVKALAETHFARPYDVKDERLQYCVNFLRPYHNIFSLNYDLLLYWACMADNTLMRRDGFRDSEDDPDADYCVFTEHIGGSEGILFVHGALHLYAEGGEVRKHTWSKSGTPLIDCIRAALGKGRYPLFVAEGLAEKKKEQIESSSYLSYCLGKLGRIQGPLVVFGWAMGDSDQHILDTIAYNRNLSNLYVGLFGDPNNEGNRAIQAAAARLRDQRRQYLERHGDKGKDLTVQFFQSQTVPVWGPVGD